MINPKIKLISLLLIFILFSSCSSKEQIRKEIRGNSNSANSNQENSRNTSEEEKFSFNEQSDDSSGGEIPSNIREIRRALDQGRYQAVIDLTEGENDFYNRYYRGIAYMCMMLQVNKFSSGDRATFRNNAEELLQEVGYQATDDDLRARGLLWYGVTIDVAYTDLRNKKKAIGAFYRIESSRLQDTNYLNDAFFYAAQTYARMGWYGVSRNYFRKASRLNNGDDTVYDYVNNQFYSTDAIGDVGSERLRSYVEGYNKAYKAE